VERPQVSGKARQLIAIVKFSAFHSPIEFGKPSEGLYFSPARFLPEAVFKSVDQQVDQIMEAFIRIERHSKTPCQFQGGEAVDQGILGGN
jgi:hypothetical protein